MNHTQEKDKMDADASQGWDIDDSVDMSEMSIDGEPDLGPTEPKIAAEGNKDAKKDDQMSQDDAKMRQMRREKEKELKAPAQEVIGGSKAPNPTAMTSEDVNPGSWTGWGIPTGWGIDSVARKVSQVANTVANDIGEIGGTFQQALTDALEEDEPPQAAQKGAQAAQVAEDSKEDDEMIIKRNRFFEKFEDKSALDQVDQQVVLASGAASFLGSMIGGVSHVVGDGVQVAHKLASTAATDLADTLQQGVSDVSELQVVSSGLKLAADHTKKIAEMGLEKAGATAKEILNIADGMTNAASFNRNAEANGQEEEELSFQHAFYIYGGPDHMEEIEALSNSCMNRCNRYKASLDGDEKASYENFIKDVSSISYLEADADVKPLQAYEKIQKRYKASSKKVESFLKENPQNLTVVGNEAVQQIAEQISILLHFVLKIARSISNGPSDADSKEDDLNLPEDFHQSARAICATVHSATLDIKVFKDLFYNGVSAGEGQIGDQEKLVESVRLTIKEAHDDALEKLHEAMRGIVFIMAATNFSCP